MKLYSPTIDSSVVQISLLLALMQVLGHVQMEGMVNDLQLAREKQQQFEEWRTNQGKTLKIDLIVTVLTTGFWPSYKVTRLPAQPACIVCCCDRSSSDLAIGLMQSC